MRRTTVLPSQEWLLERLSYNPETGELRWLTRPKEDFDTLRGWNAWRGQCEGKAITRKNKYTQFLINGVNYYAHLIIWRMVTGEDPVEQIDHIDRDRLNNRWDNLRKVSSSQNKQNQKVRKDNTSGVSGVNWVPQSGKWRAHMKLRGKHYYFGLFERLEDAVEARLAAERRLGFQSPRMLQEAALAPMLGHDF